MTLLGMDALPEETMSIADKKKPIVVRLDDDLLFQTDDGDRFITQASEIAKVLRIIDTEQIMRFHEQLRDLRGHLKSWVNQHRDSIKAAMLSTRDHGLIFIVVPQLPTYNRAFEDSITELDLDVANDSRFSELKLSVFVLPSSSPESIGCFIPQYEEPVC